MLGCCDVYVTLGMTHQRLLRYFPFDLLILQGGARLTPGSARRRRWRWTLGLAMARPPQLGEHFSPIPVALVPLCWVWEGPAILVAARPCRAVFIVQLWLFARCQLSPTRLPCRAYGEQREQIVTAGLDEPMPE